MAEGWAEPALGDGDHDQGDEETKPGGTPVSPDQPIAVGAGPPCSAVWDGLAAHRGKLLRAWLGRQRSWLVVEPRRATPEFNPVEPLWASLKGTGLANLVGDTLEEIIAAAERGRQRIRATPHLPFRSWAAADCP